MADAPVSPPRGLDLGKKVGPLPLWVWGAAGIGIYWYFQRQQKAAPAASVAQTDPAGNTGSIDPATGYVYGTPEDNAALASGSAGSIGGGSAGTNATTGAQSYADNNTWGIAAVNYLAGLGIDATTANQAVQNYLSSQPLTTAQQGDVNLAIQALGPPPSLPGPVDVNPKPVTTPGGQHKPPVQKPPPPPPPGSKTSTVSGGRVVSVSNNEAVIAWQHSGPATTWRVTRTGPGGTHVNTVGVPQATYKGLAAGHDYSVLVQPLPTGQPGRIDFKTTSSRKLTSGSGRPLVKPPVRA